LIKAGAFLAPAFYKHAIMSQLFSSVNIGNLQLKNRLVVSPMCQYSAKDGFANNCIWFIWANLQSAELQQ
jgi:hypothetical protein